MATDICVRFGRRIRELRKKRGWTQVYLAQHTGLGSVYISQLENGNKEPGLRIIEILALGFEMTPAQLLRGLWKADLKPSSKNPHHVF
jgi:transcriptional regulator with XRE-family HTH domain